jgi:RNA polymerase sigma-70 factor (ECF subfamily)
MIVNSNEGKKSYSDLYNKYYDPVFKYIFNRISNRQNSEDIISNIFLKAFYYIKRKNPRIKNFRAWIFKIASNEINMFIRSEKKHKVISDYAGDDINSIIDTTPKNNAEKNFNLGLLHQELNQLKEPGKSLVMLRFFEKKSFSDIAEILKMNENTLRPLLSQIMKELYNNLKNKI